MTPGQPTHEIEFTLNGRPFTARVDDGTSLMAVLREQAGLISPKNGCAPQGSCGCCTVLVDGRALSSCVVPAEKVEHKHVLTLEGFEPRESDGHQEWWLKKSNFIVHIVSSRTKPKWSAGQEVENIIKGLAVK